jgi:hypothetical protein
VIKSGRVELSHAENRYHHEWRDRKDGRQSDLGRSIAAIRKQGGIQLSDQSTALPDPVLLGRNESKLQARASQWGVSRWSTNLPECLADAQNLIYFDA